MEINYDPVLESNYFGIEWLETEKLFIDRNYQRPLVPTVIRNISENWDWRAIRTLAVSMREDGNYAVMDGQQRLTAARENDIKQLPCQVYIDLNEKQEAELFLKLNNSRKPSANDLFRAKIAEEDPGAMAIVHAVNLCGWELDLENENRQSAMTGREFAARTIHSATTLTQIYESGGLTLLMNTLQICHSWHGQHLAASADMMHGISSLLTKYRGKIDTSKLVEKLRDETPGGILAKASQYATAERSISGGQFSRKKAVIIVLKAIYNRNQRTEFRLEE